MWLRSDDESALKAVPATPEGAAANADRDSHDGFEQHGDSAASRRETLGISAGAAAPAASGGARAEEAPAQSRRAPESATGSPSRHGNTAQRGARDASSRSSAAAIPLPLRRRLEAAAKRLPPGLADPARADSVTAESLAHLAPLDVVAALYVLSTGTLTQRRALVTLLGSGSALQSILSPIDPALLAPVVLAYVRAAAGLGDGEESAGARSAEARRAALLTRVLQALALALSPEQLAAVLDPLLGRDEVAGDLVLARLLDGAAPSVFTALLTSGAAAERLEGALRERRLQILGLLPRPTLGALFAAALGADATGMRAHALLKALLCSAAAIAEDGARDMSWPWCFAEGLDVVAAALRGVAEEELGRLMARLLGGGDGGGDAPVVWCAVLAMAANVAPHERREQEQKVRRLWHGLDPSTRAATAAALTQGQSQLWQVFPGEETVVPAFMAADSETALVAEQATMLCLFARRASLEEYLAALDRASTAAMAVHLAALDDTHRILLLERLRAEAKLAPFVAVTARREPRLAARDRADLLGALAAFGVRADLRDPRELEVLRSELSRLLAPDPTAVIAALAAAGALRDSLRIALRPIAGAELLAAVAGCFEHVPPHLGAVLAREVPAAVADERGGVPGQAEICRALRGGLPERGWVVDPRARWREEPVLALFARPNGEALAGGAAHLLRALSSAVRSRSRAYQEWFARDLRDQLDERSGP
ncbi:MAG: hypothetical protein HYV63_18150 [Candidatus Schekmanbacteria bacterium]|nr:hypothetical protein [Candidatus Schekmanbacteria bacterium]